MNSIKTKISYFSFISICIAICSCTFSCTKKKTFDELSKEQDALFESIEKKANMTICLKITQSVLNDRFSKVDTVVLGKKSKMQTMQDGYLDVKKQKIPRFYIWMVSEGIVKGTINGVNGDYSFTIMSEIHQDEIDTFNPLVNDYDITVKDKEGYYVAYKLGKNEGGIEKMNEDLKNSRTAAKERHKKDNKVNGIIIEYEGEEGASYIYSSKKELTPEQIVRAITKINRGSINMIQFNKGSDHYADYVFDTKCIIYVNERDRIYKIINGSPIRM